MAKRVISVLLATVMTVSLLVGCGGSGDSGSSDAGTGTDTENASGSSDAAEDSGSAASGDYKGTVRFLNFKPEVSDAMQEVAAAYTAETGVDIQIETAASGQYESTLTARMDSSEAPAIFAVETATALATWKDYCRDLSDTDLYASVRNCRKIIA